MSAAFLPAQFPISKELDVILVKTSTLYIRMCEKILICKLDRL